MNDDDDDDNDDDDEQGFDDGLNTVWRPGPGHPEGKVLFFWGMYVHAISPLLVDVDGPGAPDLFGGGDDKLEQQRVGTRLLP